MKSKIFGLDVEDLRGIGALGDGGDGSAAIGRENLTAYVVADLH